MGCGLYAFRHPSAQHGLIHHAGIDALEPVIPPTQHLLQETDLGAGKGKVWIRVCPWPDEPLARYRQSLEQAGNCILIAVGPAADRVDGTLDRGVILARRPVLPILIPTLVPEPNLEEQRHALQALQP